MTFEEAVAFKNTKQSPYIYSDVQMTVHVTPSNYDDLNNFLDYYKFNKTTDETAKLFTSNGVFEVYGIGPRIEMQFYNKLS